MPSPTPPTEARGLDARPGLRLAAAALWCGFLGAVLAIGALLVVQPAVFGADLGVLSETFLLAWAVMVIPAALAYQLARPGHGR